MRTSVTPTQPAGNLVVRWLPVAMLLVGILVYGYFHLTANAIPAKGPAMTMYAQADYEGTRFARITLTVDGQEHPARLPRVAIEDFVDFRSLPTDKRGDELLDLLLSMGWVLEDDVLLAADGGSPATSGTITLWTTEVHDGEMQPYTLNTVSR